MAKIVFCGDTKFPHGSPGANYVQSLASAFMVLGYDATVCSTIDSEELGSTEKSVFRGINVFPLNNLGGGFQRIRQLKNDFLPNLKIYLDEMNLNSDDIIVSYAKKPEINKFILNYGKKNLVKTLTCPVEWFSCSLYKYKFFSPHFMVFVRSFYFQYPRFDYLFSISSNINSYYKKRGSNTFKIPFMVDITEYLQKKKNIAPKFKIIIPGSIGIKGEFSVLAGALESLTDEDLSKLEIHFTRVNEQQLRLLLSDRLIPYIGNLFILHGWLKYSELIDLYNQMHFLYLVRKKSRATISNFPSKGPETMCYGVVPIATELGDFENEYLTNGFNSIILDRVMIEDVLLALNRILGMSKEEYDRLSEGAAMTASKRFDYHNWTDQIANQIKKGN